MNWPIILVGTILVLGAMNFGLIGALVALATFTVFRLVYMAFTGK